MHTLDSEWVRLDKPHEDSAQAPFIATFSALFFLFNKLEACRDPQLMMEVMGVLKRNGCEWHASWKRQNRGTGLDTANPVSILDWKDMPRPVTDRLFHGAMDETGEAFKDVLRGAAVHASVLVIMGNDVVCVHKLGPSRFLIYNSYPTHKDCSQLCPRGRGGKSYLAMGFDAHFVADNMMNLFAPRAFSCIVLDHHYRDGCAEAVKAAFEIKVTHAEPPLIGSALPTKAERDMYETHGETWSDKGEALEWVEGACVAWNKDALLRYVLVAIVTAVFAILSVESLALVWEGAGAWMDSGYI